MYIIHTYTYIILINITVIGSEYINAPKHTQWHMPNVFPEKINKELKNSEFFKDRNLKERKTFLFHNTAIFILWIFFEFLILLFVIVILYFFAEGYLGCEQKAISSLHFFCI